MADYKQTFETWNNALAKTEYAAEMAALATDEAQASDSFYTDLEFGTAGMRGVIGLGTNRMNLFTVRRATQGLANFLNKTGGAEKGVAVACDTRKNSTLFARETAAVLTRNGIKVYLYSTPHSVPQLSFTILQLGCAAGVVITASHNPPEYNGYKVYGADGGQVAPGEAEAITAYIEATPFDFGPGTQADPAFLNMIGDELDEIYYSKVQALSIHPEIVQAQADTLNIVYTPLHGTGLVPVRRILTDIGIKKLHIVKEQESPDPTFPTVKAPNPENRDSFDLAIALANQTGADLILATDPDSDRLGLAVRGKNGEFTILSGNQIGCLLMEYVLSQNTLRPGDFVVKSIVSTDMADAVAAHYGVEMRSVYTGFKFIAEQIKLSEETGKGRFLFGFEESYGYLFGTFTRDKDAIQAAMMVAEMACWYGAQGKTLADALNALYETYGWFSEVVVSDTLYGQEGIAKIKGAVEALRENPPAEIGGFAVTGIRDYQRQTYTDCKTGAQSPIPTEPANVLYLEFKAGRCIIRPSGTEPKLKTYLTVQAPGKAESEALLERLKKSAAELIGGLLK